MNRRGEIAPLAAIASPNVAVVTNVGTAHIEFLGSRDAIAVEKGDLIAALDEDAVAVLNADDDRVMAQAERTRARILRFGQHPGAEVRAERITSLGERGFVFDLVGLDATGIVGRIVVATVGAVLLLAMVRMIILRKV